MMTHRNDISKGKVGKNDLIQVWEEERWRKKEEREKKTRERKTREREREREKKRKRKKKKEKRSEGKEREEWKSGLKGGKILLLRSILQSSSTSIVLSNAGISKWLKWPCARYADVSKLYKLVSNFAKFANFFQILKKIPRFCFLQFFFCFFPLFFKFFRFSQKKPKFFCKISQLL